MNGTIAALEPMIAAGRGHVRTLFDLRREEIRGVKLSAVCPDGIWTPMLQDKLDDARRIAAGRSP
jgi:hypothetical protein